MNKNLHFFLGGHDLEMIEIAKMLKQHGAHFSDKSLAWGARVSDYEKEICAVLDSGVTAVLVELEIDVSAQQLALDRCIIVDHHGKRAGKDEPTAIEQVAVLLGLEIDDLSRWQQLVSANDKGHIQAMQEMGARADEIAQVRRADRRAQGITIEQETASQVAIEKRQMFEHLTIVETDLETSSAIADFMQPALGGPGYENLLIFLKSKAAFFGRGDIVLALAEAFPDGWYGGALPETGFWGAEISDAEVEQAVLKFVQKSSEPKR